MQGVDCDYIVVGSGAGGGTVAARLAEAGQRVVLLEAGGDPRQLVGGDPVEPDGNRLPDDYDVPTFHPFASENDAIGWHFFVRHYADDQQQRRDPAYRETWNGRAVKGILYPRASCLGGCTAYNALIFVAPDDADWDAIAALMLPAFDSRIVISTPLGTICHGATFGSNGRINFGAVTWQGTVAFTEESEGFRNSGIGSDHDINLDLTSSLSDEPLLVHNAWPNPPDRSQPPPSLLLEFDRTETIDNFGDVYWVQLRNLHDAALQPFFSDGPSSDPIGRTAVVTGLLGIDSVHEGWTELHPVYALAMRVPNSQVRRPEDLNTEHWAYFVRNWGNEGFCARNDHPVPFLDGRYVFRLPWKAGMGMVMDDGSEFLTTHRQIQRPVIDVERDAVGTANAVLVRFVGFPDPMAHAQVDGVLHLRWTRGSPLGPGVYASILKWLTW